MAVGPASVARPAPVTGRPLSLWRTVDRESVFSWLMLTPGVLFLLAFVAYPFFYGMFLSLSERRGAHPRVVVGVARSSRRTPGTGFSRGTRHTVSSTTVAPPRRRGGGGGQAPPSTPRDRA